MSSRLVDSEEMGGRVNTPSTKPASAGAEITTTS